MLMGQHAEYLRGLGAEGRLVVAGPVAEGAGAWGLAVFEASDEGEVRRLADADPVVRAGRGFGYEILPMLSAMIGSNAGSGLKR